MKIINKTSSKIYYQVTPSGGILKASKIVASGFINKGDTLKFSVKDIGLSPVVYVKGADSYCEGNLSLSVKDGNSTVEVSMSEVND